MQTDSLNSRGIALFSLLTILLMPHTLADDSIFAISQYPNDDYDLSSSSSLNGDPSAEPFGNLLVGSNGPKIADSNWAIDHAGLKLNSNLQDGNPESLLMTDTSIPYPKRRGKRGSQNEKTYCKSPYSGTITTPTPETQEGESGGEESDQAPAEENQAPDDWQGSHSWPKLDETSGQTILWLQLRSARGVEPEGNLRVCNKNGMYPICYPYKYPDVPPLVDPALIVEPCRLWVQNDWCNLEFEELWCCQYAKERPVDEVLAASMSVLSFSFNIRYRSAGLDCTTLDNPTRRNTGQYYT